MRLDVSSLTSAIRQLEKSLGFLRSDLAESNADLREQFRAASIQAFEFVYEVTVKMIRRQMEQITATPAELQGMSFIDLMRSAAGAGLVREADAWRLYRNLRNRTTRTYDADEAEAIVKELDAFLQDARFIAAELQRRNDGDD